MSDRMHSTSMDSLHHRSSFRPPAAAFTLVELLVVCAVIAMILAMALPPMVGSLAAARLTNTGDQLLALFSQAQQIASSEGRPVEARFYKHVSPDTPGSIAAYRTVILMRHYDAGEPSPFPSERGTVLNSSINVHHGESLKLSEGTVVASAPAASSVLTLPAPGSSDESNSFILKSTDRTPYKFPVDGHEYRSFIFRPNSTNLPSLPSSKWFITLVSDVDEESGRGISDISNYYCIQIDPVNGRVTSYRP
jgi:uncharacterized protein (TIGR02596 family)